MLGRSCCEVADDEHLATLTRSDVSRIRAAIKMRSEKFVDVEWMSPEECAAYEKLRPIYQGYFAQTPARLTLRRQQGRCIFLSSEGCSLPPYAKPIACHLYPLQPSLTGEISLQAERHGSVAAARLSNHACLAAEEAETFDHLLEMLGMSREQHERLSFQLRDEVKQHAR
jgi:uncharacterized protein